jgi:hypothetical protein
MSARPSGYKFYFGVGNKKPYNGGMDATEKDGMILAHE